jgi:L-rhamnose-H+ transport protein
MNFMMGLFLVLLSGVMAGSSLSPIKFIRKYRFENYWLIFGLVGTLIIPWCLALFSTPHLFKLYSQLPWKVQLLPPVFAFSWGVASMLAGLCVSRIGLSLTYALVIGTGASAGALVPLLYFSPDTLHTQAGRLIVLGIVLMLGGVAVVTRAGKQKEAQTAAQTVSSNRPASVARKHSYVLWVLMALLAGMLSAGLNFSFAFGQALSTAARSYGASNSSATYVLWAWAMLGGMVPNVSYPVVQCFRNHSWNLFVKSPIRDMVLSVLLGALFMSSTALYGVGATRLGVLGPSVGWGVMQIMQIVVGNLSGFLAGEWKHVEIGPVHLMFLGVGILVTASLVMAYGNFLQAYRQ